MPPEMNELFFFAPKNLPVTDRKPLIEYKISRCYADPNDSTKVIQEIEMICNLPEMQCVRLTNFTLPEEPCQEK